MHQVECAHWCLAVANVSNKQIDTFKIENSICLQVSTSYLQRSSGIRFSRYEDRYIRIQSNEYYCEGLVCLYACCIAERSTFNFNKTSQLLENSELLTKKLF